ncbi:DUF4781 domain-containing protein [Pyxidicoccus xibeiensis]|uniref:DUF4781 domain-containing protein n=1 Tax=Pyxidicoccus xibeiensis TaxID=2906759 RepID=UPI0020A774BB|nr:DUF4781 domain-containing protein [Pyxidicoccus xibeiensis]MCP3138638.1 DUF4781 domain-containing protein [Pyxidicoccus xibeiensis]
MVTNEVKGSQPAQASSGGNDALGDAAEAARKAAEAAAEAARKAAEAAAAAAKASDAKTAQELEARARKLAESAEAAARKASAAVEKMTGLLDKQAKMGVKATPTQANLLAKAKQSLGNAKASAASARGSATTATATVAASLARADRFERVKTQAAPTTSAPAATERLTATREQRFERLDALDARATAQRLERVEAADVAALVLANKVLPPDDQSMVLTRRPPAELGAAWAKSMKGLVGPGKPEALDAYLATNQHTLDSLARSVSSGVRATASTLPSTPEGGLWSEQLYRPAMTALKADHPDATFALVAARNPTGNSRDPETDVVIAMTHKGRDGRPTTEYFSLDASGLRDRDIALLSRVRAAVSDPALPELGRSYQAAARTLDSEGAFPGGVESSDSASDTFDRAADASGQSAFDPVLRMTPAEQVAVLRQLGRDGRTTDSVLYGGLLRRVEVKPEDVIVATGADHLATGAPVPGALRSRVNVSGAPGLNKTYNFIDKHADVALAPLFTRYTELRGDTPRPLSGDTLTDTLAYALQQKPCAPPDAKTLDKLSKMPLVGGFRSLIDVDKWPRYDTKAQSIIKPVQNRLEALGGPEPRVTVVPIVYNAPEQGMVQLSLFRVEGQDGKEYFVDNTGSYYQGIEDWKANNKLPPGRVTYPAGGHLQAPGEKPRLVTENTHAVVDTTGEKVVSFLDDAALVGGVVLTGMAVFGTGGAAAPVAGVVIGAYGAGRSGEKLYTRATHGDSVNPLTSSEARADWLNVIGGMAGVGGVLARPLGASGKVAGAFGAVGDAASAATAADAGYQLAFKWDSLPPEQRLAHSQTLLFWGMTTASKPAAAKAAAPANATAAPASTDPVSTDPADVQALTLESSKPFGSFQQLSGVRLESNPVVGGADVSAQASLPALGHTSDVIAGQVARSLGAQYAEFLAPAANGRGVDLSLGEGNTFTNIDLRIADIVAGSAGRFRLDFAAAPDAAASPLPVSHVETAPYVNGAIYNSSNNFLGTHGDFQNSNVTVGDITVGNQVAASVNWKPPERGATSSRAPVTGYEPVLPDDAVVRTDISAVFGHGNRFDGSDTTVGNVIAGNRVSVALDWTGQATPEVHEAFSLLVDAAAAHVHAPSANGANPLRLELGRANSFEQSRLSLGDVVTGNTLDLHIALPASATASEVAHALDGVTLGLMRIFQERPRGAGSP